MPAGPLTRRMLASLDAGSMKTVPRYLTNRPWRAYLEFLVVFDVLFFAVYVGAGRLAAATGRAIGLYAEWERHLPLIPWSIIAYLSLYTVFLLPLVHLTAPQMRRLTLQSVLMILVAGAIFVAVPTRLGFAPEAVTGPLKPLFDAMRAIDTPYNMVPSLHVAFAALLLIGCASCARPPLAWFYAVWLVAIAVSTVTVHQHHLLDVATGLALAAMARRLIPLSAAGAAQKPPAEKAHY